MRTKTYIFQLSDKDRKRHEHLIDRGRVSGFIVQYEILLNERWVPVVRYDTAHGFAHKDIIGSDGREEKIFIGIADLNEALIMADRDINENWERYKERYLRRVKK